MVTKYSEKLGAHFIKENLQLITYDISEEYDFCSLELSSTIVEDGKM
jgi:hypothetical protein